MNNRVPAVSGLNLVLSLKSAANTTLAYQPLAVALRDPNRFHEPTTVRRPITGVHVNVLTPEALRTVVGVARADDGGATVFADKVFRPAGKALGGQWRHTHDRGWRLLPSQRKSGR